MVMIVGFVIFILIVESAKGGILVKSGLVDWLIR